MASNHPNKGAAGYKTRRSWFDTPPLTILDPLPDPKAENVSKRSSLDVVEILTLTHFTNPPKIMFGKTCVGKTKVRTLLLRNPHDFEQEVIIEKFPYKKKFMVNQTRCTVSPEEVFSIEITWAPEEDGGCREMIQFHINDVYRLQAFVIGTAYKPKPPRKIRKFAPFVRQPPTVVHTPALNNIRKNYSPTCQHEAHKEIKDLVSHHHCNNDNKENSEERGQEVKCRVVDIQEGGILKLNWEAPNAALGQIQTHTKINHNEEVAQTPTPLESTTIVSKQEIDQTSFKNKRRWRHISDITSPTLNMSPIPLNEGNEHGIIVDSYFQANEMSTAALSKSEKLVMEKKSKAVEKISAEKCFESGDINLKETFVLPLLPDDNTKIRRPINVEDNVPDSSENRILVSSLIQQSQQIARADETRIIEQHDTVFKGTSNVARSVMVSEPSKLQSVMCSELSGALNGSKTQAEPSWSPPKLPTDNILVRASEISPRTMLDESLTLISQMVRVRSTNSSPKDNNTSINSSLISQGQGIVSPNSFMEDMRSMMRNSGDDDQCNNAGKTDILSPSLILNNAVPYKTMVSHLQGIRQSLHKSPLVMNVECRTPKKSQAAKFVSKRRSITSQFQKEEIRKIATAARSVNKDKELITGDHRKHRTKGDHASMKDTLMVKRQGKGSSERTLLVQSLCRGMSDIKNKETDTKTAATKLSPLGKRSSLARSPLAKKYLKSMQVCTTNRTKNKISQRKKSSPLRPLTASHGTNKPSSTNLDLNSSAAVLAKAKSNMTSQDDCDSMFTFVTPKKDDNFSDSYSDDHRSIDSGTVVKAKSHENTAEISGRIFDCLFEDEKRMEISQNISLKREKLFPDIHVVDDIKPDDISQGIKHTEEKGDASQIVYDDADIKKVEKQEICVNEFKHHYYGEADKILFDNMVAACPSRGPLDTVFSETETPLSPQRFGAMSPSNLPTSPVVSLDHSKRGTITLTKSRVSDALTTAMDSGKRLFQNTPQKPSSCSITGEDTETQENIRVDVEEHYQEIDGKMYVIVKETTNVTKSTTETYMEHLTFSPQFQTPTRLPNSPDLVMSRRSTHVVKSPKVINIASFKKRQIDFIEEEESKTKEKFQLKELINQQTSELIVERNNSPLNVTHENSDVKCVVTKSDTFEKESTLLATPMRHCFLVDKSEHPITSVCAMSPSLVDYEDCSESGSSGDVTKDSLDTNQSADSLVSPIAHTSLYVEENKPSINLNNIEEKMNSSCDVEKCIIVSRKKLDKNCMSKSESKEDFKAPVVKMNNINSSKLSAVSSGESEDEQFYDTMSERYYDALSDTGNPEVEDMVGLKEAAESDWHPTSFICDSNRFSAQVGGNWIGVDRNHQSEVQRVADNVSVQNSIPVMATDVLPTKAGVLVSFNLIEQTLAVEMTTDRKERFEVIEREVFDLCSVSELKPVDEIIRSTPEAKIKRKLRRSVSADTLMENKLCVDESVAQKHPKTVKFSSSPLHVPKCLPLRKPMSHSKSAVLNKPAVQLSSTRFSPVKTTKGQLPLSPRIGTNLRSQSLSNLSRQTEMPSIQKEHHVADKKGIVNRANQVTQTVSKQKNAKKGVAQGRLILVKKKPNAGIPRHPLLFAAKNMYYDERWMEKQERGFVQWLNFVLTPPDEYMAATNKTNIDAGSLSLDIGHVAPRLAPTKEVLSFRSYAARRRLNRLRRSACELYQSESFVNIICKIEVEVESRRICVRKDKMVHADVGIKQKLLDLLLHYSSLWLRIGLETIFGEVLMLQSNQDVLGLSRFILTRLLASPDIAAEFAHQTVPHLYKQGYVAAVSRHTVKKFLLLVYFLDQAKSSRLIDHDPCLFCKDAGMKSSKEILIEFSREVLSGEGDITRHLAYLGYTVSQSQKQIDEFDFAVINLSSDLRDGLRLCRVLELLAGDHSIMTKLRTPAISRLQKIHNTGLFFKAMCDLGLDFSSLPGTVTTTKDVVDGHREKTLALLWQLIIYFQSSIKVNEAHLREEIDILVKSLQLKVAMQQIGAMSMDDCAARRDSGETRLIMENKMLQLILEWCRLVCLHYGIKVENFTVSFSDGRALCCLLHHYHPALLPLSDIHFQTTISLQEMAEDKCQMEINPDLSIDWARDGGGLLPDENNPDMIEQLLANEKSNYKTLYEKVSALGGVPLMLKFSDMSNTIPNEKVVSTFVTYLCARLLDIREEVRAARTLQMAWRRKQLWRAVQKRQRRTQAAVTIQRWIRPYLVKQLATREPCAVTCIQTAWQCHSAHHFGDKLQLNNQEAVWKEKELSTLTLQNSAQLHVAQFQEKQQQEHIQAKQKKAVITIQKHIRGLQCRKEFSNKRASAIKIQSMWRRHLAQKIFNSPKQDHLNHLKQDHLNHLKQDHLNHLKQDHLNHLKQDHLNRLKQDHLNHLKQDHLNHSAIVIQKWMKRNYCISRYTSQRAAVISLQKCWRRRQAIRRLQSLRNDKCSQAATIIQKYVRARLVERKFQHQRQAAVVLQSCWRRKQARRQLAVLKSEKENKAAVLIQSVIKSAMCRQKYLKVKRSICLLQINWKRTLAQRTLNSLKTERDKAAIVIQKYTRGYLAQFKFHVLRRSTIILQSTWRMLQARKKFKYLKQERQEISAIVIQQYYRRFRCRQIQKCRSAALTIQKAWRMHQAKKVLAQLKQDHKVLAAVTIQRLYRGFIQRRSYIAVKSAVIVLQKCWRRILTMRHLDKLKHQKQEKLTLVLQKNLKMWKHRRYFLSLRSAAIVLQNTWRMVQARRIFLALKLIRQENSAILIQRMWKGYVTHQMFITKRKAAVKIQSFWRMIQVRKQFWRMKEAASLIQTWHRANLESKRQSSIYFKQRKSVICIQSWLRCQALRRKFQMMRLSAVVIQRHFRCFQCRQKFLAIKFATLTIQQGYRHYLEGLGARKMYITLRNATIVIQKSFRRYLQKKHIRVDAAALVLQTAFRKTNARKKFLDKKLATLTIQKRFREYREMKSLRQGFLDQRQAACVIQWAYRTLVMKRQYIHFRHSITKLQAYARSRILRNRFKKLKNAAIIIQRRFRTIKISQDYHEAFLQLRTSAVIIQRFYRAVKARRMVQKEIAYQHSAATKIQAIYRGWSQRQDYLLLRSAAICLQRRYRSHLAGRAVRVMFRRVIESVHIIQRRWRSYQQVCNAKRRVEKLRDETKVRHEEEKFVTAEFERRVERMRKEAAAVLLQRSLRAYMTLKSNTKREQAALVIQKHIRGHQSRMRYYVELKHICYLQHLIRGFVCRRKFERMKLAARIIQTRWREIREGRRCHSEFIAKLDAVFKIQTHFMMKRQRKIYQVNMTKVVIVQAFVRTFIEKHRFKRILKCIVGMQRRMRSNQQMRQDRERFLKYRHCAIKIQTVVRLWLAYKHVQRERCVLKIPTYFQMHQHPLALQQAHEAIQVQKLLMEIKWQHLDTATKEATHMSIQSSLQRYLQSCQTERNHLGASIIQRTVKCLLDKCFQEQNNSAHIIQRALRRYVARRRMIKNHCAVMLQTCIRLFLCRRGYLVQHRSVVVLQAAVRGWHARRLTFALKRHRAAVCLQAVIRGFLVRKKLSPVLKERLFSLQEQTRQKKAAVRIQALWRGSVARRNTEDRKLIQARKRLQQANRDATSEKTLGSRTSSALDYLLKEKDLAQILEALMHLEVSTRLSPKCCEKMVEVNAVSVLYRLINSCNRSIPHMELIKYSVNILLNLAKYEKTIAAVIEPQESISSILELLQIYREKGSIFKICCMLLWVLGLHPGRRVLILKHPLIVDRLQSIHVLALRKQRTSQNRQAAQAKMAAMRNFNYSMPVLTPSKSKRRGFRPDWALAGDNMKDFEDPVVAVLYVMDVLQIKPKI